LIVEDNELSRDMLSRRLRRRGYEVIVAVDSSEAIAIVMTDRPDIVLGGLLQKGGRARGRRSWAITEVADLAESPEPQPRVTNPVTTRSTPAASQSRGASEADAELERRGESYLGRQPQPPRDLLPGRAPRAIKLAASWPSAAPTKGPGAARLPCRGDVARVTSRSATPALLPRTSRAVRRYPNPRL
jgi:CheY-like chemotaxis protein